MPEGIIKLDRAPFRFTRRIRHMVLSAREGGHARIGEWTLKLERLHRILGTRPAPKPPPLEPPKPVCPCCGNEMTLLQIIRRPPRWMRRMRPARAPPPWQHPPDEHAIHSTPSA